MAHPESSVEDDRAKWWEHCAAVLLLYRILNFALSIILFCGVPITHYLYTVPYMLGLPVHLGHTLAAWRYGPDMTNSKLFANTLPLWMIGFGIPPIIGFAGPIHLVPFGNYVLYTAVQIARAISRFTFSMKTGVGEHGWCSTHGKDSQNII